MSVYVAGMPAHRQIFTPSAEFSISTLTIMVGLWGRGNKIHMENKKTSELLDLIWELENAPDEKQDWDKVTEAYTELLKRTPYNKILGESEDCNDPTIEEVARENVADIKLLKRHKHDEKSGDVLVRI